MPEQKAAQKLFNIPELVEGIATHLPHADIVRLARLNTAWRDMIKFPPPQIRHSLWMECTDAEFGNTVWNLQPTSADVEANPALFKVKNSANELQFWEDPTVATSEWDVRACMLLTHPPAVVVDVIWEFYYYEPATETHEAEIVTMCGTTKIRSQEGVRWQQVRQVYRREILSCLRKGKTVFMEMRRCSIKVPGAKITNVEECNGKSYLRVGSSDWKRAVLIDRDVVGDEHPRAEEEDWEGLEGEGTYRGRVRKDGTGFD